MMENFQNIQQTLNFEPNQGQKQTITDLLSFISPENTNDYFVLTGSAGSGKTSLLKVIVDTLNDRDIDFYLASPTGRAAQVLTSKTGCFAKTLHSLLYTPEFDDESMKINLIPKINRPHKDFRIFLVDESSMISDNSNKSGMFIQNESLLKQLMKYAKAGNSGNKIIFVGDQYQLPPVNAGFSPALSSEYLSGKYNLKGQNSNLEMVERQQRNSYILKTANSILTSIKEEKQSYNTYYNCLSSFSYSINDYLKHDPYNNPLNSVMIAFSNGQVNALNTWARKFRYNYKNKFDIMPDELMICNKNCIIDNNMLAKGNHFKVLKTWKPEEFAGSHFINAEISFINERNIETKVTSKILTESVTSQDGNIPLNYEKQIYHEAYRRNKKFRESKNPQDDAFVNAIRARYGYALTCHKAQGGEWENVYIHPGFRKDNLKWLYTAVTRASKNLYSWAS